MMSSVWHSSSDLAGTLLPPISRVPAGAEAPYQAARSTCMFALEGVAAAAPVMTTFAMGRSRYLLPWLLVRALSKQSQFLDTGLTCAWTSGMGA